MPDIPSNKDIEEAAEAVAAMARGEWDAVELPPIPPPPPPPIDPTTLPALLPNQMEFGPDCDPKTNLCKTPMCTAGHLINMAGEVGYKLLEKYDWTGAATRIHRKNRPDVPPQNFNCIPQEWALAYIRERAAEETGKAVAS